MKSLQGVVYAVDAVAGKVRTRLQERVYSVDVVPKKLITNTVTLDKIYEGSKLGLRFSSIAYNAELTETELRQIEQLDPRVSEAIVAGRADQEIELTELMMVSARSGDAKSTLEILKAKHGWISAQVVKSEVTGANGGPIALAAVDLRSLSNEEIEIMTRLLEKTVPT
jgi:hypothetical protein